MIKLINKIYIILRAKLRNKDSIKDQWYLNRLDICNKCVFNSKYTEPENKSIRYHLFKYLNLFKNFCTVCDCEIKAKASEEMEKCPKNKWKQIL